MDVVKSVAVVKIPVLRGAKNLFFVLILGGLKELGYGLSVFAADHLFFNIKCNVIYLITLN